MAKQEKKYTITPSGSLGLLALGDIGLEKWREVCAAEKDSTEKEQDGGETEE